MPDLPAIGEMDPPHPLELILPQDSDYEEQQEFRGYLHAGLNGIYLDNKKRGLSETAPHRSAGLLG